MKKRIIRIVVVLVVLLLVAVGAVFIFLDSIVKKGVETVGPKVARVDVRLAGAKISPFSGSGELTGLFIGNPEGFKTPSAITVGDVKVAVKVSSVFSDVIQVEEVHVQAPEITLEAGLTGSNLGKILDTINESASKESAAVKSGEKKPGKKIYIKDILIEGGKINVSVKLAMGKSLTVPLPAIHIQNIGTPEKGATTAEAAQQIMNAVLSETTKAAANVGGAITKGARDVGEGAVDGAGKAVNSIKGLFK